MKKTVTLVLIIITAMTLASCGSEAVIPVNFEERVEEYSEYNTYPYTRDTPSVTDEDDATQIYSAMNQTSAPGYTASDTRASGNAGIPQSPKAPGNAITPDAADPSIPAKLPEVTEAPQVHNPLTSGSEGLEYKLSADGRYYILSSVGSCKDTVIIVAPTYNGKPVKEIGAGAFRHTVDRDLKVILPDGITKIGREAFLACIALSGINIPSTVTEIDDGAFKVCESLKKIEIPNSVRRIGDDAFNSCGLTSITIPSSVTRIGKNAFSGCTHLETITVAGGNPSYRSAANCLIDTSAKRLIKGSINGTIPNDGSVRIIGESAFACYDLRCSSIDIPSSVTKIESRAFSYCSIDKVTIPASVKEIGSCAFEGRFGPGTVIFKGDAPAMASDAFSSVTATVFYTRSAQGWDEAAGKSYGGSLSWRAQ